MGKKKFHGFYQLPREYQDRLTKSGFWDLRHDGSWMKPEDIDYLLAEAIMKSFGLYWDTSLPRILEISRGRHINIEPGMGYFKIVFYPVMKDEHLEIKENKEMPLCPKCNGELERIPLDRFTVCYTCFVCGYTKSEGRFP